MKKSRFLCLPTIHINFSRPLVTLLLAALKTYLTDRLFIVPLAFPRSSAGLYVFLTSCLTKSGLPIDLVIFVCKIQSPFFYMNDNNYMSSARSLFEPSAAIMVMTGVK